METLLVLSFCGAVVALALLWYAVSQRIQTFIVYDYETALLYRDGRFRRVLQPGRHRCFGTFFHVAKFDNRLLTFSLPVQEIMTRDRLGVRVSLVLDYRITDAKRLQESTVDWGARLYSLMQLELRAAVEALDLEALLSGRETVGAAVLERAAPKAADMGLNLETVSIRDIMIGKDLRTAYAAVELARKEGEAALERARGETAALRNLSNGARLLKDNPAQAQLRLVQGLSGDRSGKTTVVLNLAGLGEPAPVQVVPLPDSDS